MVINWWTIICLSKAARTIGQLGYNYFLFISFSVISARDLNTIWNLNVNVSGPGNTRTLTKKVGNNENSPSASRGAKLVFIDHE